MVSAGNVLQHVRDRDLPAAAQELLLLLHAAAYFFCAQYISP